MVWSIGLVGAALSLLSRTVLDRYADFMLLLGGLLVPVGGVLLGRFFASGKDPEVAALYATGPGSPHSGFMVAGMAAWAAGAATYFAAARVGGTLPSLAVSLAVFLTLRRSKAARA